MKICSKCNEPKGFSDFQKDNRLKSGLSAQCKKCCNKAGQDWRIRNRHKVKGYNLKYRPQTIERYNKIQNKKQKNNKCLVCKCSLLNRTLLTRYCLECKTTIKKEWKRNSYKRNIPTVLNYNKIHRLDINCG